MISSLPSEKKNFMLKETTHYYYDGRLIELLAWIWSIAICIWY